MSRRTALLMRLPRRLLLVPLTGLAFAAMASNLAPVAAGGSVSFDDVSGDGTIEELPIPANDPTLDITGGTVAFDGKNFVFVMHLSEANPTQPPNGHQYRWRFTYEGVEYGWYVWAGGAVFSDVIVFDSSNDDPAATRSVFCGGCRYEIDDGEDTISIVAPVSGLARAIREATPEATPFGVGSTISNLELETGRDLFAETVPADRASGDELIFTL